MNILVAANSAWYVHNFRGALIGALVARGHGVAVLSPGDGYVPRVRALGVRHVDLDMDVYGKNPLRELGTLIRIAKFLRAERPDLVLTFTPKVNIYVCIVSRFLKIPVIANVSGLGRAFTTGGWLKFVSRLLYRFTMRHPRLIFFQNEEDRACFLEARFAEGDKTARVPGSGVDLERFAPVIRPERKGVVFLLAARLAWDKGVGEFVEAARRVGKRHPEAEFRLLGFLERQNPSAVPRSAVEEWEAEGVVRYLGAADDVRPHYADADCAVLPSTYREGIPRSLLEAAGTGLPIITTDSVGCRDAVEDGKTGFLCRMNDPDDLAEKMERVIGMTHGERVAMGGAGRARMEREFDERIVVGRYLSAIDGMAAGGTGA